MHHFGLKFNNKIFIIISFLQKPGHLVNRIILLVILTLFRAGGRNPPPSTFLYLAQKPLYFINGHLSTFPIYLLGLRICKKIILDMGCAHTGVTIKYKNLKKGTKIAHFELNLPVLHNSVNF